MSILIYCPCSKKRKMFLVLTCNELIRGQKWLPAKPRGKPHIFNCYTVTVLHCWLHKAVNVFLYRLAVAALWNIIEEVECFCVATINIFFLLFHSLSSQEVLKAFRLISEYLSIICLLYIFPSFNGDRICFNIT